MGGGMSPYDDDDDDVEDIIRWYRRSTYRIDINGGEVFLLFIIIIIISISIILEVVILRGRKDSPVTPPPPPPQPSPTPSPLSASFRRQRRRNRSVTLYSPKTQTSKVIGTSAKRRYVSTHRVVPSYFLSSSFWNMIFVLFPVCRRHSFHKNMTLSWIMLRQSHILLQLLPKVTSFATGRSPTLLSPAFQHPHMFLLLSNDRVMVRSQPPPIGYHTTTIIRWLSSSSPSVVSDDGTMPSTKPPKRTPLTTKRSVSAVAVPRLEEDLDDDAVCPTDSKKEKGEDTSIATLTTTTTMTKAKKSRTKVVKDTTKVPVETSPPKTPKKSKNVMTSPPLAPPAASHVNDTTTTIPSFNPHVGGLYGKMASSYAATPDYLAVPNATTTTIQSPHNSSGSSNDTESRRVSTTTTTTDHSHSDGHSSPDYIVLSRTPVPTTTANNNTPAANQDAGGPATTANDVVVPDSSGTSTTTIRDEDLLNPYDLIPPNATTGEWKIPYPKSLSPSSIKEFQACPQSFLFQYILGLRQPTTPVLAKGSMCHAALERIFDIEPPDRSLAVLQNLFRTAWSEQRSSDTYRILFEEDVLVDDIASQEIVPDGSNHSSGVPVAIPVVERRRYVQRERSWGLEGLALLQNYWMAEDASSIQRPNPVQREVWVKSNLPLVYHTEADHPEVVSSTIRPISSNVTNADTAIPVDDDDEAPASATMSIDDNDNSALMNATIPSVLGSLDDTNNSTIAAAANFENSNITKFLVRGIVDRLDMVQDPNNKSEISLRLIDYKSGKAPDLKYSPSMNSKIQNEAFDQLLIYALLLREANRNKVNPMPLRYLRLFYLTSVHDQKAIYWDMDLGATQEERDALLRTVHVSLSNVYRTVCQLIDQQNFMAFIGCQRSFCYCHKCRPKFKPGTVWEPPK